MEARATSLSMVAIAPLTSRQVHKRPNIPIILPAFCQTKSHCHTRKSIFPFLFPHKTSSKNLYHQSNHIDSCFSRKVPKSSCVIFCVQEIMTMHCLLLCRHFSVRQKSNYRENIMSSDLLKILRPLKGNSIHHDQNSHNGHYENYQDVNHGYDDNYKSHGKHFFSGIAFKAMRKLSGKRSIIG